MALADLYEALTGVVDHQPWRERAACKDLGASLFLGEKGDSTREAKAVCASCEVCGECLDYALEHCERFGIWGGTSERERKKMRRTMPPRERPHGTLTRYNRGCHCAECRAAYAKYRRQGRVREVKLGPIAELRTQRNRRRVVG